MPKNTKKSSKKVKEPKIDYHLQPERWPNCVLGWLVILAAGAAWLLSALLLKALTASNAGALYYTVKVIYLVAKWGLAITFPAYVFYEIAYMIYRHRYPED